MGAVENFRRALVDLRVDDASVAQIMEGYEKITDKRPKAQRAAFFAQAIKRMDTLFEADTCHAIRDACACSKGGWRLKAVQKLAKACEHSSLEEKIEGLRQITHMGNPVLNDDGTITAGIGGEEGCPCACPVFDGLDWQEPVSLTYCYCCAGKKLITKSVVSSALDSLGKQPCRFVYEIVE
jgi:hypothetical protein